MESLRFLNKSGLSTAWSPPSYRTPPAGERLGFVFRNAKAAHPENMALVDVDPSAKSSFFCGFSGKPFQSGTMDASVHRLRNSSGATNRR